MPVVKHCPIKLEREYVQLTEEIEPKLKRLEKLKQEFRIMASKGYDFKLVRVDENIAGVFCPPWKKLCYELIKKFMTESQRKAWMKSIMHRFPKKQKAASVKILKSKEVDFVLD